MEFKENLAKSLLLLHDLIVSVCDLVVSVHGLVAGVHGLNVITIIIGTFIFEMWDDSYRLIPDLATLFLLTILFFTVIYLIFNGIDVFCLLQ